MDKVTAKKVATILLKIKAISLNPKKPFKFSSGILSPVYIDNRVLISHPKERKKIIDLYVKNIKANGNFDVIAGTATAGIPHAAWISEKLKLPMVYVRGKAKDHGKGNQIEGVIKEKQNVAVIEDHVSTGESCLEAVNAVKKAGAKAPFVFSITTYSMKKALDNFSSNKTKLIPLLDFETIVKVAADNKYIKKNDQSVILEWVKDPSSWGKKMGFEN